MGNLKKNKYSKTDLAYMSALNSAVLSKTPFRSRMILWIIVLGIFWFIIWASITKLDEITRGKGKVIPGTKVKIIQNLEGGIIETLFVKEGDIVKKGQPLLKLKDIYFSASLKENKINLNELMAKRVRLYAEAYNKPFKPDKELIKSSPKYIEREKSLYKSNIRQLKSSIKSLEQQLSQKRSSLKEIKSNIRQYNRSLEFLNQEIDIKKPLVEKGIVSTVELLKLKREKNDVQGKLRAMTESIVRVNAEIREIKEKIKERNLLFQNKAKEELNKVVAEISRINELSKAFQDKVSRTVVKSPVDGIIKQIFINTIGGVVRPGMPIMEVVPNKDELLVEAKIKPSDIAFIQVGQKAIVKLSAYDFSIYGGLEGTVINISADTIIDENDNEPYYLVKIKTKKNYLGTENHKLFIKVGMRATVDIITGKKSLLSYLLKPILKAKENALRER
jgi:adhesin transport system membrane fusion protein